MPVPAAALVSVSAQVSPAPPRSWMPTTRSAAYSSRHASISSFSVNGSPTCTLGRRAALPSSKVALASTDTPPMPSRPVFAPSRTTMLPGPGGGLLLQAGDRQDADAQRVDQRVALVARVEDQLAADVGQAQAVAVPADAGHDAGQHPGGVRVVGRAEAQRVHHRDRPGAHGEDVPDDAADAGRRALVGLDEARVVVRLDLEGDGEVVGDLDHAGVLADAGEQPVGRRRLLPELAQVHLARLVRAVLAPHDRVHRQLGLGRPAAEDLADPLVLVVLQAQLAVRLLLVRRPLRPRYRIDIDRRRGRRVLDRGHAARSRCGKVLEDRGEEAEPVGRRAGQRLDRVLGMRHDADDVAGLVADRRDVARRAVGVAVDVAGDHPAVGLQLVERAPGRRRTGPRRS